MEKRYIRNLNSISEDDMLVIRQSKILVVGCGGLGGYIIELLLRLGVGSITAIDADVFDETNLNRQLLSTMNTLGKRKCDVAKERALQINPDVAFNPISKRLSESNAQEFIHGHDVVMDAVDNVSTRLLLEKTCSEEGIPLIHGAIAGWFFQIGIVMPNDNLLQRIYSSKEEKGIETTLGNPSFTPAAAASFQVAECIKLILKKDLPLKSKLLYVDLLNNSYDILEL
jgi:molybdopterin/thiamine biosynthesis adenylyltransferase